MERWTPCIRKFKQNDNTLPGVPLDIRTAVTNLQLVNRARNKQGCGLVVDGTPGESKVRRDLRTGVRGLDPDRPRIRTSLCPCRPTI